MVIYTENPKESTRKPMGVKKKKKKSEALLSTRPTPKISWVSTHQQHCEKEIKKAISFMLSE